MRTIAGVLLLVGCAAGSLATGAEPVAERAARLRREAAAAAREGQLDKALGLASKAIVAAPDNAEGFALRAGLHARAERHERAIDDYDRLLELDPKRAGAYDQRGSQHFMLGRIDESIDDFDRFLKLQPDREPWHWKRGISYYYAGRYHEGRRQFEGYQTVDDNDVENAVWRYLCMARGDGVAAARRGLLKIKRDPRVPMMAVYALYAGQATADDVMAAARAGSPTPEQLSARLFYAHLYLGLYAEANGDAAAAKEHLATAAEKHKIGHYMWNVAEVHAKRLQQAAGQPQWCFRSLCSAPRVAEATRAASATSFLARRGSLHSDHALIRVHVAVDIRRADPQQQRSLGGRGRQGGFP